MAPNIHKTTRFRDCHTFFGCETKKGVLRILVSFQGRPMISHIIRSILKNKGVVRILIVFQDRTVSSHIIQKVSARAFH